MAENLEQNSINELSEIIKKDYSPKKPSESIRTCQESKRNQIVQNTVVTEFKCDTFDCAICKQLGKDVCRYRSQSRRVDKSRKMGTSRKGVSLSKHTAKTNVSFHYSNNRPHTSANIHHHQKAPNVQFIRHQPKPLQIHNQIPQNIATINTHEYIMFPIVHNKICYTTPQRTTKNPQTPQRSNKLRKNKIVLEQLGEQILTPDRFREVVELYRKRQMNLQ